MTKTVNSPRSPNKELPVGEGARCRQKKTENTGARRRAPDSPCPKAQGAQYQRPTPKSNLEASGYPCVQNICHRDVGRDRTRWHKVGSLFDITRPLTLPSWRSQRSEFVGSSSAPQATGNSLMHGPISALAAGRTLFRLRGLPDSASTLL